AFAKFPILRNLRSGRLLPADAPIVAALAFPARCHDYPVRDLEALRHPFEPARIVRMIQRAPNGSMCAGDSKNHSIGFAWISAARLPRSFGRQGARCSVVLNRLQFPAILRPAPARPVFGLLQCLLSGGAVL